MAIHTKAKWAEFLTARDTGKRVEISKAIYWYFLEVLPPVTWNQTYVLDGQEIHSQFGFAEGTEEVTAYWREGKRYFCQKTGTMNPHV